MARSYRLIVAAVVADGNGRVLLARRAAGAHLEGLWEFPGGGVEPGEAAEDALRRELVEELGIEAEVGSPLTFAWHHDDRGSLLLLFYRAAITAGAPRGLLGQEVAWVPVSRLHELATPPADADLIRVLQDAGAATGKSQK